MPRSARVVVPEIPHHVIQRGNRRQDVFFSPDDYRMYLSILKQQSEIDDFIIHAYCLMKNHIHLIVTPKKKIDLRAIGVVNRRYAYYLNRKMGWSGYLWQGRFTSYPMDEAYVFEALRYVEINPVAAGICKHPREYRWSSARQRIDDHHTIDYKVSPIPTMAVDDWEAYWADAIARRQMIEDYLAQA